MPARRTHPPGSQSMLFKAAIAACLVLFVCVYAYIAFFGRIIFLALRPPGSYDPNAPILILVLYGCVIGLPLLQWSSLALRHPHVASNAMVRPTGNWLFHLLAYLATFALLYWCLRDFALHRVIEAILPGPHGPFALLPALSSVFLFYPVMKLFRPLSKSLLRRMQRDRDPPEDAETQTALLSTLWISIYSIYGCCYFTTAFLREWNP